MIIFFKPLYITNTDQSVFQYWTSVLCFALVSVLSSELLVCTVSLRRLQLCFSRWSFPHSEGLWWEALIRAALYIIDTLDETQNSL